MDFAKQIKSKLIVTAMAVVVFWVVSVICFAPQLSGEVLPQHDVTQYDAMTRDILQQREQYGEDPQWTGAMFSGMPGYLINVKYPAQLVKNSVGQIVKIADTPLSFTFFAMLSAWCMMLIFGVNPWVGIISALAYGLSTYFFLIIGAGHITKMWAAVYAPMMVGGAYMTLRRSVLWGGVLTALFVSLEIGANHPQISYYFLLVIAALWISELIYSVRGKLLRGFARRTAVLLVAGIIGVGSNFAPLWYTMQHTPETVRGGSELTVGRDAQGGANGLDLEYATAWSYGVDESLTMLIPDFMGGASTDTFAADGELSAALAPYGMSGAAEQLSAYWGEQPFTAGPTYLGAMALLFALLALLLLDGREKWWILAVSVLMILLSWGRNFMWFTELFYDYFPLYNKFRTVSMSLVVVQWSVPLLGGLVLDRIVRGDVPRRRLLRAVAWSTGVVGGVCLLVAVAGGSLFDFGRNQGEVMMTEQLYSMFKNMGAEEYISAGLHNQIGLESGEAMAAERASIASADAMRSLLFVLIAAAAAVALGRVGKRGRMAVLAGVAVFMVADLQGVNSRYLSYDNFVDAKYNRIRPTAADAEILKDKDLGYRVLNLSVSPFNDATTSYFHRSIGGYHGAKLARYQDVIDNYLVYLNPQLLDMLNTRYIIRADQSGALTVERRDSAAGAAWFVGEVVEVKGADEELDMTGAIDPRREAVVDKRFAVAPKTLGEGEIALVEYRPSRLKYEYSSAEGGVAVFSEIYYDKGWKAYIDGVESPYFRANYLLRAMELPAGRHTVEWQFRAPGWAWVESVTAVCSVIILLSIILTAIYSVYDERRQKTGA